MGTANLARREEGELQWGTMNLRLRDIALSVAALIAIGVFTRDVKTFIILSLLIAAWFLALRWYYGRK